MPVVDYERRPRRDPFVETFGLEKRDTQLAVERGLARIVADHL